MVEGYGCFTVNTSCDFALFTLWTVVKCVALSTSSLTYSVTSADDHLLIISAVSHMENLFWQTNTCMETH